MNVARLAVCVAWLLGQPGARAQDRSGKMQPEPTQVFPNIHVIGDEIVREQWTASLALVNAPTDRSHVEPGQCISFAVFATGDKRDEVLSSAKLRLEFVFAGKIQPIDSEGVILKQVKPEGGDFVTQALGAAGIANPVSSLTSMAASQSNWCAPADVRDGIATIRGVVEFASGDTLALKERKLEVKGFVSARRQPAFEDIEGLGSWMQRYHAAPDPAQLLLGLRLVGSDANARSMHNIMAFFIAALQSSPVAAEEIIGSLPGEQASTRIYAIPLLRHAGYPTDELLREFPEDAQDAFRSIKIPDPFDIRPDTLLPNKMDMLWATFFATGKIEPVKTIVSMLAWRDDYEKFSEMKKSGTGPTELTDSIMRGVVYAAAGWSLNALSLSDGLVADYLDAIKVLPDLPAAVKAELANLPTNPAFRMAQ